jgi:oxygen-independent coproporphyrinogen-3 oxidase
MMQAKFLELLEQSVPRYTSYPTANHFKITDNADCYEKYLMVVEGDASLYIHIPFCSSLCSYCGCFTRVPGEYTKILPYIDALVKEIDLVGEKVSKSTVRIKHIHFGGGTPTFLKTEDLKKLFEAIHKNFFIDSNSEIAVELDPRILNLDMLKLLKDFGVNRISLGVQDFNEDVQKTINRIQPFDVVAKCVEALHSVGIGAINFDLIYGLPFQTVEKIEKNMRLALSLNPNRIAYFGYAHTPWIRNHQKLLEKYVLPNAYERYQQFHFGKEYIVSNGYCHIGLDHFAQDSDPLAKACYNHSLKRNFQGYTTDTTNTLIGLGVSAISSLEEGFFQNTLKISDYKRTISSNQFPIRKKFILSEEDKLRHLIISNLMCFGEVNLRAICVDYYEKIYTTSKKKLLEFETLEFIKINDNNIIKITELGKPMMRLIASCFDYYLENHFLHAKIV